MKTGFIPATFVDLHAPILRRRIAAEDRALYGLGSISEECEPFL
jgi:hypothetical protein